MKTEQTLVIIKPPHVTSGDWFNICLVYEQAGLIVVTARVIPLLSADQIAVLYGEHRDKPFYPRLVHHMTSGIVMPLLLEGPEGTIELVRQLNGPTNPIVAKETDPDSIRARWGSELPFNVVHASANADAAKVEMTIFF